jgi:SAM-dependent methyltransferase
MRSWVFDLSARELARKVRCRVIPNLVYLPKSRIRTCGACQTRSLFLALGNDGEFQVCMKCRANHRYELIARYLREAFPDIGSMDVLELDDHSPLRTYLSKARSYTRSYYRGNVERGAARADGVVCQDITRLTYPDCSLDLIISSDVLEHVPDVTAAFRETCRVLRPGGAHVFTVPPRAVTRQRARVESGRIVHLEPPDYHRDPLSEEGILAFWDFGPEFPGMFSVSGLTIRAALAPDGLERRVVWEARRI